MLLQCMQFFIDLLDMGRSFKRKSCSHMIDDDPEVLLEEGGCWENSPSGLYPRGDAVQEL